MQETKGLVLCRSGNRIYRQQKEDLRLDREQIAKVMKPAGFISQWGPNEHTKSIEGSRYGNHPKSKMASNMAEIQDVGLVSKTNHRKTMCSISK